MSKKEAPAFSLATEILTAIDEPIVVIDIESTGLFFEAWDEPIEVCAIKCYPGGQEEIYHRYIKPHKVLPKKIIELTQITPEMLKNEENKYKVLPSLRAFIGDSLVVGHNVKFDVTMLNFWFLELGLKPITKRLCTMDNYRALTKNKVVNLTACCNHFAIPLLQAHSAIEDTKATAKLFKFLLSHYKSLNYIKKTEKEAYVEIAKRKANSTVFKKNRELLCNGDIATRGTKTLSDEEIIKQFNSFKTPADVVNVCNNDYDTILNLFCGWLNHIKISKVYRIVSDGEISKFIEKMISYSDTYEELINLHMEIFKTDTVNHMTYRTYFTLAKESENMKYELSDLDYFFRNNYSVERILAKTKLSLFELENFFVDWAIKNKTTQREIIAINLVGRKRLKQLLAGEECETSKDRITMGLYNKGFFWLSTN